MKFIAKKIDIDLELTTLSGEVVELKPKFQISGKSCIKIAREFSLLEKNNNALDKNDDTKKTGLEINAIELSMIYPKEKDWFVNNFDPQTIVDILVYVTDTIAGVQKN